jgi:cytochrome bd-type quinol oxidase subunit 2
MIRLMVLAAAGVALLVVMLIGFFVVLPLVLAGGIASYFYLRRRLRQAPHRSRDGVIDAEYTVIDHR